MKMRSWVECGPLNIRVTVEREGDAVYCRVDPGVPHFEATPGVLRALARVLLSTADTADDVLDDVQRQVSGTGLIHNPKNLDGRLPVLPTMVPAKPDRRYVRGKSMRKPA